MEKTFLQTQDTEIKVNADPLAALAASLLNLLVSVRLRAGLLQKKGFFFVLNSGVAAWRIKRAS